MKKIINAILEYLCHLLPEAYLQYLAKGLIGGDGRTFYPFTTCQAKGLVQAAAKAAFPDYGHGKTPVPLGVMNVEVGLGVHRMSPSEAADFYEKAAERNPWAGTWAMAYVARVFDEAWYQANVSATYDKWSKEEDWPEEYTPGYFSNKMLEKTDADHIIKALAEYLGHARIPDAPSTPTREDLLAAAKDVDHAAQVAWDEGMGPSAAALAGMVQKYFAQ